MADRVARLLVIMGSGETSPTMVTVHQRVFARLGPPPVPAVLLDTPFGFQENADDIATRALDYFRTSVGREVQVATYRSGTELERDPLGTEQAFARIAGARWVFAGPGSPTYALRTWAGSPVHDILAATLRRGGAVTFASAAALTLGVATVPVYEVYKSGETPGWREGLDLLGAATGLRAAVIPHYDNAEGGNHDTRFCYLGERRLRLMEPMLPAGAFVLGIDEHTGLVLDLDTGSAAVVGRGVVTVRRDGESSTLPSGETVDVEGLANLGRTATRTVGRPAAPAGRAGGDAGSEGQAAGEPGQVEPAATAPTSLVEAVARREEEFADALARRAVDDAVRAILGLNDDVAAWSRDTLQSDERDRARAALRSMVVRLGELAREGALDRRAVVAPYVEALLDARGQARAEKQYDVADALRDRIAAAGIEVRDTPAGVEWTVSG